MTSSTDVTSSSNPAAPTCVLVVEDDADAREIYERVLRLAGYEVVTSASIADGRRAAAARRPGLVVLDCDLPDGSGLELLRAWRRSAPMDDVPVVMVTAFSEDHVVAQAARAGANAFLVKPCSADALTEQLGRLVRAAPPGDRRDDANASPQTRTSRPPRREARELAVVYSLDEGRPFTSFLEHEGWLQARCSRCLRGTPRLGRRASQAERQAITLGWASQQDGWTCPVCIERDKTRRRS